MRVGDTRLTTVLKVKQHQENTAQRELKDIQAKKAKETDALTTLETTQKAAYVQASEPVRVRATDAQVDRAFIQRLSREIKTQQDRVDTIHHEEDSKREELVVRSQSKKMVEKLDDKRKQEALKEVERKEQKVLDVLASRIKTGGDR